MNKYKITNVDAVKGQVTFQILDGTTVVMTDTRGDLPFENAGDDKELDAILSKFANDVVADKATRTVDAEVTKMVGVSKTAKTEAELAAKET